MDRETTNLELPFGAGVLVVREGDLLSLVGVSEAEFEEYLSLDDWDYALLIFGDPLSDERLDNLVYLITQGRYLSVESHYFKGSGVHVTMVYHA